MSLEIFPKELILTNELVYNQCKLEISNLQEEKQSAEYSAYTFQLNSNKIKFRVAKITPTKVGQFVTLWQRCADNKIYPFDISDNISFVVINVKQGENFGQFVFPKSVLCKQNIFSQNNKGGKRAFRVYPAWDKTISPQAQKTQKWQLEYFLDLSGHNNNKIDYNLAQKLYANK
tara:strand:+ start:23120 stop:23641 length:522 start_codon:yes stop_codon:yes gene_type:complete